mgnify:CR=1 FL=1
MFTSSANVLKNFLLTQHKKEKSSYLFLVMDKRTIHPIDSSRIVLDLIKFIFYFLLVVSKVIQLLNTRDWCKWEDYRIILLNNLF